MSDPAAPPDHPAETPSRKLLVRPFWLVGGFVWGAALFLLLQQYAVFVYSNTTLIIFALAGVVLGLLMPNLAVMIAEKRQNPSETKEEGQ